MKLQVLMCAYNERPYIQQAIESVLAQKTNFDFQLVIGENCSTDGTREIVQSFAERYPTKIKAYLNPKNILGESFRNIYNNSTAEYVAILNSDDFWTDPLKLQKQVDLMDKNPDISFSFHNVKFLNQNTGQEHLQHDPNNMQPRYTLANLLGGCLVAWPSVVYRKGIIPILPELLKSVTTGDWALHILYAEKGDYAYINEVMACYRLHDGNAWEAKPLAWRLKEVIRAAIFFNKHFNYEYTAVLSQTILNHYKLLTDISINKNDYTEALNTIFDSLNDVSNISFHEPYLSKYLKVFFEAILKMIENNDIKAAVSSYKKGVDTIPFVKELHGLGNAIATLETKVKEA